MRVKGGMMHDKTMKRQTRSHKCIKKRGTHEIKMQFLLGKQNIIVGGNTKSLYI